MLRIVAAIRQHPPHPLARGLPQPRIHFVRIIAQLHIVKRGQFHRRHPAEPAARLVPHQRLQAGAHPPLGIAGVVADRAGIRRVKVLAAFARGVQNVGDLLLQRQIALFDRLHRLRHIAAAHDGVGDVRRSRRDLTFDLCQPRIAGDHRLAKGERRRLGVGAPPIQLGHGRLIDLLIIRHTCSSYCLDL